MAVDAQIDLSSVPLFPLPGVVLFPKAVLPLHIFEDRYKQMTADALAGQRRIAMALLQPGWEKSYYGRPEIERIVCVGKILSCERLPEGNTTSFFRASCARPSCARSAARLIARPSWRRYRNAP